MAADFGDEFGSQSSRTFANLAKVLISLGWQELNAISDSLCEKIVAYGELKPELNKSIEKIENTEKIGKLEFKSEETAKNFKALMADNKVELQLVDDKPELLYNIKDTEKLQKAIESVKELKPMLEFKNCNTIEDVKEVLSSNLKKAEKAIAKAEKAEVKKYKDITKERMQKAKTVSKAEYAKRNPVVKNKAVSLGQLVK